MTKPKPRPNECTLLQLIDAIAGKWPLIVISTLWEEGPMRFNALQRNVGASQKMLAQTLRALERDGLVSRTVTPTSPITVEYAMTPLGQTLAPSIQSLWEWSDQNFAAIRTARNAWEEKGRPV